MITVSNLAKFFHKAVNTLKALEDGCMFTEVEEDLYAVCTFDPDEGLIAKLAYNCDDLQCDYDFDWYFPATADEDLYIVEDLLSEDSCEENAEYFVDEAKIIIQQMHEGIVLDWHD